MQPLTAPPQHTSPPYIPHPFLPNLSSPHPIPLRPTPSSYVLLVLIAGESIIVYHVGTWRQNTQAAARRCAARDHQAALRAAAAAAAAVVAADASTSSQGLSLPTKAPPSPASVAPPYSRSSATAIAAAEAVAAVDAAAALDARSTGSGGCQGSARRRLSRLESMVAGGWSGGCLGGWGTVQSSAGGSMSRGSTCCLSVWQLRQCGGFALPAARPPAPPRLNSALQPRFRTTASRFRLRRLPCVSDRPSGGGVPLRWLRGDDHLNLHASAGLCQHFSVRFLVPVLPLHAIQLLLHSSNSAVCSGRLRMMALPAAMVHLPPCPERSLCNAAIEQGSVEPGKEKL